MTASNEHERNGLGLSEINRFHSSLANFIWGIADDCLRDAHVCDKYRDVILLMTVIRRLGATPTRRVPAWRATVRSCR